MSDRAEEIFRELSEICEQYKAEVPSDRRAWPESAKSRVFELKALGITFQKIAEKTGIAAATIYTWKKPQSFLPVRVVEPPSAGAGLRPANERTKSALCASSVTVSKGPKRRRSKFTTVTVITPGGCRIEGLDSRAAMELVARLESK